MFEDKQYTLRAETTDGITRYFVSFTDGQGKNNEIEVSRPVYQEFLRFVAIERSLCHWDERYREHSVLTEEALYNRAVKPPKSLEDSVIDDARNEHLRLAIQLLPDTQQRRFVLYHDFALNYEQIAEIEGCSFQAVAKSVKAAEKNILEFLKKFEKQG